MERQRNKMPAIQRNRALFFVLFVLITDSYFLVYAFTRSLNAGHFTYIKTGYWVLIPATIIIASFQIYLLRFLKEYFTSGQMAFHRTIAFMKVFIFTCFSFLIDEFWVMSIIAFSLMLSLFILDCAFFNHVLANENRANMNRKLTTTLSLTLPTLFICLIIFPMSSKTTVKQEKKLPAVYGSDLLVKTITKFYSDIYLSMLDYEMTSKRKADSILTGKISEKINNSMFYGIQRNFNWNYPSTKYSLFPKSFSMEYFRYNKVPNGKITLEADGPFFKKGTVTKVNINDYTAEANDTISVKGKFNITCNGFDSLGRLNNRIEFSKIKISVIANKSYYDENNLNNDFSFSFSGMIIMTDKVSLNDYYTIDSTGISMILSKSFPFIYRQEVQITGMDGDTEFSAISLTPLAYRTRNKNCIYSGVLKTSSGNFEYALDYEKNADEIRLGKDYMRLGQFTY